MARAGAHRRAPRHAGPRRHRARRRTRRGQPRAVVPRARPAARARVDVPAGSRDAQRAVRAVARRAPARSPQRQRALLAAAPRSHAPRVVGARAARTSQEIKRRGCAR